MPADTFAARLLRLRDAAGMSTAELAAAAGISRKQATSILAGRASPSWETVCALAQALGASLDDLARPKK